MSAFVIVMLLQGEDSCLQPCSEWEGKRRLCKIFLFGEPQLSSWGTAYKKPWTLSPGASLPFVTGLNR